MNGVACAGRCSRPSFSTSDERETSGGAATGGGAQPQSAAAQSPTISELKNQWGFRGYCSQRAVVTELAARLALLTYNLWSLFTRLLGLNPGHHSEAVKLAVKAEWWTVLKACYERLRTWLAATAPPLEAAGEFLRRLARQTTEDPNETLLQPASG